MQKVPKTVCRETFSRYKSPLFEASSAMEEQISVTLSSASGQSYTVPCRPTDSIRSIVVSCFDISPRERFACHYGSHPLEVDLSLASQGVSDGATINVAIKARKGAKNASASQRKRGKHKLHTEILEEVLLEENLRVSDVALSVIDSCKGAPGFYEMMMKAQDMHNIQNYYCDGGARTYGVDVTPTKVSTDPLPVCWAEEDGIQPSGGDVAFVVSSRNPRVFFA